MTKRDSSFGVHVDVTNPGQFFACCGLLELAHRLSPTAAVEGWFSNGVFCVSAFGFEDDPLARILQVLCRTRVHTDEARGERATHPVHLDAFDLTLDWWIDDRGRKTPLKLWAGQQTSDRIVRDLRDALLEQLPKVAASGLFDTGRPLTGRFGVDPRAAWNPLDVGFSPNEQGMEVVTFPAVELLAAVGVQRFRPADGEDRDFRYATWTVAIPACVARGAAAGLLSAGEKTSYRFRIASRGSYKGFDYSTPIGDET